jgi:hypothetical protein
MADREIGAFERPPGTRLQLLLERAFPHVVDEEKRPWAELHGVVWLPPATVVAIGVGQGGETRRGGDGERHGEVWDLLHWVAPLRLIQSGRRISAPTAQFVPTTFRKNGGSVAVP